MNSVTSAINQCIILLFPSSRNDVDGLGIGTQEEHNNREAGNMPGEGGTSTEEGGTSTEEQNSSRDAGHREGDGLNERRSQFEGSSFDDDRR